MRVRSQRISVKRRLVAVGLPTLVVNGTTLVAGFAVPEHPQANSKARFVIKKIVYLTRTVAVDADGTILLNVFKKRGATQTQLVTSFSLEGVTADDDTPVTIDAAITLADRTLKGGDVLYFSIVNNSVAIDTNPATLAHSLIVELEPVDLGGGEAFGDNDGLLDDIDSIIS